MAAEFSMDEVMDELQLYDDRFGQDERVEIRLPHAAVEPVDGDGQRNPGIDEQLRAIGEVRLETVVQMRNRRLIAVGADVDSVGARRLQRVDHVNIVCPGLCKILPWMRCRIGGDEGLLPIGRRTVLIMLLQRIFIILPLVAKDSPASIERLSIVPNQPIPVIMGQLMTKMTDERAVGFAHADAPSFALGVVGFSDIDCDEPAIMAGLHHLDLAVRLCDVAQELEGQSFLGVLHAIGHGQVPAHERTEHIALRELDPAPLQYVLRLAQIGNGEIMPAGLAIALISFDRQNPVADTALFIRAEDEAAEILIRRHPFDTILIERDHLQLVLEITDAVEAIETDIIVEMHCVGAMLAKEKLHQKVLEMAEISGCG